jgi:predicted O-linked N-acetylglucosamine transferase (SPINDLY family)
VVSKAAVSLDPPAWSGANTTVETLDRGVPVVTLPQNTMRSRHSLAFIRKAKVEGLVASTAEDYVDLATNEERRLEAMKTLDTDAMFKDDGITQALHNFFRKVGRA